MWGTLSATAHVARAPGAALAAWGRLAVFAVSSGIVPLAVGVWLLRLAIPTLDQLVFSLGFSCALAGSTLLVRWLALAGVTAIARRAAPATALVVTARARRGADRATALVVGGGLALYWSLPFDAPAMSAFHASPEALASFSWPA